MLWNVPIRFKDAAVYNLCGVSTSSLLVTLSRKSSILVSGFRPACPVGRFQVSGSSFFSIFAFFSAGISSEIFTNLSFFSLEALLVNVTAKILLIGICLACTMYAIL